MRLSSPLVALVLAGCTAHWESIDTGNGTTSPPEVYLTEPSLGSTWEAGQDVTVRAVITDDVDDVTALVIEIRSDLEGVVATPTLSPEGQLDATIRLDPGTHRLTVAAVDSGGLEGSDTHTIRVTEPGSPTQPGIDLEPSEPVTGDDLVASVVVASIDPEGDPLTYVWSWTVDGADAGVTVDTVDGALVEAGQTWTVSVVATDGEHESPVATRSVTVGNGAPDPGEVWITPETPAAGDTLTCNHGQPIDPEGDDFTIGYAWWVDGAEQGATGPDFDAAGLDRGSWVYCEVIVDDGVETRFPSVSVLLGNSAPSVGGASVTPTIADETTTLTCRASGVTDPDDDPVSLSYRWLASGVEVGTGQSLTGAAFDRGDTVQCEVIAADAMTAGEPVTSNAVLVDNSPPDAPTVGFLREDLIPGVEAECAVLAASVDADGDALAYAWSWTVDGAAVAGSLPTFDTSDLDAGQALGCRATPDDGFDAGTAGTAELLLGAPTSGDLVAADSYVTLSGSTANGAFGKALDRLDDLDGDGLAELVVSAPRGSGSSKGAAYIFTAAQLEAGAALTDADATWWWTGYQADDNLGGARGVAGPGDVDGDGTGDLLLAAPVADDNGTDSGTAYLLYGGEAWTPGADVRRDADARFQGVAGDWLGARMAGGDLDGDGISDVIVTAPYNDQGGSKAGAMAVWFGVGARLSGTYDLDDADALVTGAVANSELGWALDVTGDMNADGYADVAVGLIYDDTNGADAGSAAVISGGDLGGAEDYDTVAFLVVHGVDAGARFGYDVNGLGDIDGDGFEDVAMGAYLSDDVGEDGGRFRVFHGAAGLDRAMDEDDGTHTILAEGAGDQFGSLLLNIGDFDQDGMDDLLAGAPRASAGAGGSASGTAYLYAGAEAASWGTAGAERIRVFGGAAGDWLSDEAAGGLDIDGDGFADFALGAQGVDTAEAAAGAVYVFKGP